MAVHSSGIAEALSWMDGSNVHTSVVIELANQGDSDAQKMYQVDFNDVNSSKDYVIDQIFCGENVTVYALFEMEEECSKSSDIHFHDTRTTEDLSGDVKTCRLGKCYLNELKGSDDNEDSASRDISRKESFYCLQQYLDDSDPEEEHSGLIKPCKRESVLRCHKSKGKCPRPIGTRSMGVNTDIALCPKLLDEVQKVIAAGFPVCGGKRDGDKEETRDPSIISPKLSTTFIKTNASSSTSSLNLGRKSSLNFLLVPLVMTEEGLLKQFLGKENQNGGETKEESDEKDETSISKNETNFNMAPREGIHEGEQRNLTGHVCTCKLQPEEVDNDESKNAVDKVEDSIFSRRSILEEIKNVQWKLTSIIHSLESNVSGLTKTELNRSREAVRECIRKISREMISTETVGERFESKIVEETEKLVEETEEPKEDEKVREVEKPQDLPVFASVSHLPPSNGSQRKKRTSSSPDETTTATREISATSSVSTASTTSTYNTFSLRNILENSNENLKEDLEFFEASERSKLEKKWRGTSVSKSDSNMWLKTCGDLKWSPQQHSVLKKSQSLDLRQEKAESFSGRKLKNVSYNPDNNSKGKGNVRNHTNPGGNSLPNGLTQNMGDEINIKEKMSKSANLDFDSAQMKEEEFFSTLKRDILEMQPMTEEDAKQQQQQQQKSPKNRLTLPQFLYKNDKVAVGYCGSNGNVDASVGSGKVSIGSPDKLGVTSLRKTVESRRKMGGKEKTTSIYSRQKLNVVETSSKRDIPFARDVKRTVVRRTVDKPTVRTDRKDAFEQTKQKLLYRAVKSVVRANPDSKLHIDKLVKSAMENYTEPKTGRQIQEEKVLEPKNDALLSRPPSQRRRRDVSSYGSGSKDKNTGQYFRKTSRSPTLKMQQKGSLERILQKEKTDQVLIFDKKFENVFVAKKVPPEMNGIEPETGQRKPQTAVQSVEQPQQPVVVELYSKKPATLDECTSDEVAESSGGSSLKRIPSYAKAEPVSKPVINIISDEDAEKAIVKSVWALTKVLLYGDGTKKFEILEASLTPPEYSLKTSNSYNENEETSKNR